MKVQFMPSAIIKTDYVDLKLTISQATELKKLVTFEIETEHLSPHRKMVLINILCKLRRAHVEKETS